jgi:hypothetical protein
MERMLAEMKAGQEEMKAEKEVIARRGPSRHSHLPDGYPPSQDTDMQVITDAKLKEMTAGQEYLTEKMRAWRK